MIREGNPQFQAQSFTFLTHIFPNESQVYVHKPRLAVEEVTANNTFKIFAVIAVLAFGAEEYSATVALKCLQALSREVSLHSRKKRVDPFVVYQLSRTIHLFASLEMNDEQLLQMVSSVFCRAMYFVDQEVLVFKCVLILTRFRRFSCMFPRKAVQAVHTCEAHL